MRFNLLNAVVALLLAVAIYVLFRTKVYMVVDQAHFHALHDAIKGLQLYCKPLKAALPGWVVYSLPDGLWTYAFTSFFVLHFRYEPISKLKIFALVFTPILSISFEVGQHFHIFPGTFDFVDLFFDFAGSVLPFFLFYPSCAISTFFSHQGATKTKSPGHAIQGFESKRYHI